VTDAMLDRAPRRGARNIAGLSICAAITLLGSSGCTSGSTDNSGQTPPSSAGPVGNGNLASADPTGSPDSQQGSPSASPAAVLADGKSAGIIAKIDLSTRAVTFDPVDLLTGDAMKKYLKDHPDATDPFYTPAYVIVNDNSDLLTLPLATNVTVRVVNLDSPDGAKRTIKLASLPAHLKAAGYHDQNGMSALPFSLTVLHGQITGFEEQPPA
jgi:hypothetical protein